MISVASGVERTSKPQASRERLSLWARRGIVAALAIGDALTLALVLLVSIELYAVATRVGFLDRPPLQTDRYLMAWFGYVALCLYLFWRNGSYRLGASVLHWREARGVARATFTAAAILFAILFLARQSAGYSRLVLLGAMLMSPAAAILQRRVTIAACREFLRSSALGRRVLIYGCGETGRLLMKKIVQSPMTGLQVAGFIDDLVPLGTPVRCRLRQGEDGVFEARVLARGHMLRQVLEAESADLLLVAAPNLSQENLRDALAAARTVGVDVGLVPGLGDVRADQLKLEDIGAVPVLSPFVPTRRLGYRMIKRSLDLALSVLVLVAGFPLTVCAALAIRLDSEGPVFFRQDRVGLNGRVFRVFKFRTMYVESDPYAPSPRRDSDSRITRVGRWLRLTGFDEMPQFLNVLLGEMAVVGPRPEMPFVVDDYTGLQRQRLMVKPGITGLWQLSPDRDAQIHENIEYDLYYVRNCSWLLDTLILLETWVFTLSIIVRRLLRSNGRRGSVEVRPADEAPLMTGAELSTRGYLLAALDQRLGDEQPSSWPQFLPALPSMAVRTSVKILVASENTGSMDAILKSHRWADRDSGSTILSDNLEFVPYRSRRDLENLTIGADLVVTDLPHVQTLAQLWGIDVLFANRDGVTWSRGEKPVESLVSQLYSTLPATPKA